MLCMNSKDAINSASSITQTLSGELADGQRKLLAIAAAGSNSKAVNPLVTQLSNGPLTGLHEMVHTYKLPLLILQFCPSLPSPPPLPKNPISFGHCNI